MRYYADGKVIRSYAAITGASLSRLLSGALGTDADADEVIFTVGTVIKVVPIGPVKSAATEHAAIKGESDGEETVRLSRGNAEWLATFAVQAGRKRVYLFTSNRAPGSNGGPSVPASLEASYGDDNDSVIIPLRDAHGAEHRMSIDLYRRMASDAARSMADNLNDQASRVRCGCEHTSHFNDDEGPQTGHDYQAVPAGDRAARYVGPVCNECARTCMVDNLIKDAPAPGVVPEFPPGVTPEQFADIEYAATYDPETMPAPVAGDPRQWATGGTEYPARKIDHTFDGSLPGLNGCGRVVDGVHCGQPEESHRTAPTAPVPAFPNVRLTVKPWVFAHLSDTAGQRAARMPIGERGPVRESEPERPDNGKVRVWRRTINGTPYGFTVVNMPDGELRLVVRKYNGYGDDGTEEGRALSMRFGCAWSQVHSITLRPESVACALTRMLIAGDEEGIQRMADDVESKLIQRGLAAPRRVIDSLMNSGVQEGKGGPFAVNASCAGKYETTDGGHTLICHTHHTSWPSATHGHLCPVARQQADDSADRARVGELLRELNDAIETARAQHAAKEPIRLTLPLARIAITSLSDVFTPDGDAATVIDIPDAGTTRPGDLEIKVESYSEDRKYPISHLVASLELVRVAEWRAQQAAGETSNVKALGWLLPAEEETETPAPPDRPVVVNGPVADAATRLLREYEALTRSEERSKRAEAAEQRAKAADGRDEDLAAWCRKAAAAYDREAREAQERADFIRATRRAMGDVSATTEESK